jgi:hypothetical protein
VADVDLATGVLTIRGAKFGKTRLVPIHPSTQRVLARYAARRDRVLAGRPAPSSSRAAAPGWTGAMSIAPSMRSPGRSGSGGRPPATAPACMIFGTDLRSRRCASGTGPGRTPSGDSPSCRPISATCTWRTPTGT